MAQPDLRQLQVTLTAAGNELAKIPNMPIFAMQDQILGALDRLQRSMQDMHQGLDARMGRIEEHMGRMEERIDGMEVRMDRIEVRMDTIEAHMDAMDQNMQRNHQWLSTSIRRFAFTRLQNSKVLHPHSHLFPMCGINGQPIENFPLSPRTISELNEDEVDRLLGSADLPLHGTIEQKKDRFRIYIGLSVVA